MLTRKEKEELLRRILTFRKGKVNLRTQRPKGQDQESLRAYFVWRMARFHGGEDLSMPIQALQVIGDDEALPDLKEMADKLAKRFFGSDMRAVNRFEGLF